MKGFSRAVKDALQKARDSALLAVEVYNKPAITFKSGAYITLMVIAWTSLFHAIFLRRRQKPYYRKPNGRYERIDGDFKHWELGECLNQYYGNDTGNAVRKNIEFFIPLRNKIEHRPAPELDPTIFGECQAMLLNFDEMLEHEFGSKYRIRQCLSFALQMYPSVENLAEAVKRNRAVKATADFIEQYRSSLSPEVYSNSKYAFRAFLIQVANHESQDALPIRFFLYDKLSQEQKEILLPFTVMIKEKHIRVANVHTIPASKVALRVQEAIGNKFNVALHTKCWKHYNVRPVSNSATPEQTDIKYCIYDKRHNDYGYTEEWVKFLIEHLRDEKVYRQICACRGDN